MNDIATLVLLTHPAALEAARNAYQTGEMTLDDAAAEVVWATETDDTFNEYSGEEMYNAIADYINEK